LSVIAMHPHRLIGFPDLQLSNYTTVTKDLINKLKLGVFPVIFSRYSKRGIY